MTLYTAKHTRDAYNCIRLYNILFYHIKEFEILKEFSLKESHTTNGKPKIPSLLGEMVKHLFN